MGAPRTGRRRARRRLSIIGATLALAMALGAGIGSAGSGDRVLRTLGDESLVPNVRIQATLKFQPGQLRIASGDTLTIMHDDKTAAPHTVTIVNPTEQPQTIEDVFDPEFCPTCDAALGAHFGADMPIVDVGGAGFDSVGDSVLFFDDQTVTVDVTAAPGSTLSFMCAIHPWMQGTLNVT